MPMTRPLLLMTAVMMLFEQVTPCLAENRQASGGAFMNSYTSDPYFDPKSVYSQSHSLGDIGGQVMLTEPPGFPKPCALFDRACVARFERPRRHFYP